VRTGRVVRCIDTDTDARADRPLCRSLGIRSAVVVPIRESSHVAGFLEAFSGTAHGFSSEHVRLLRSMAELVCKARNKHMRVEAPQPEGQPIKNRGEQLSTVLATLEQQDHEAASPSAPHEQVRTDASAAGSEQLPDAIDVLSGGTRPALCSSVSASASVPVPASSPQIFRGMPPGGSGHGQSHPQRRTLRPAPRLIKRATGFLKTIVRTAVIVWITCTIVLASLFAYQRTSRQWRHMESSRSTRQGSSQPHSTKEPNQQPADGRMLDIGPFADAVVSRGMALYQFTADVMTTLVAGTSAPPAGGSGTQPISGGKLLYKVDPVYPARIASGDREVILRITVDKTGTVQGVQVLSGPPALADRARAAVKRWRYEPFLIDNRPVNMERIVILPISAPKG
jgi:TonB family protein